ncbi:MAG TPA: D-Ala-D-Ala carboxypeptidase family metallohydrolase [Gemmatimonadaceae bacterium]|nr:D-Ala-D-Ala carboxypeptidase family metallohydrolase [Gemmatimonadaceae bacterium]
MESAVVSERRDRPTGEELLLPDDLPVRKRHTTRVVWIAVGAIAFVGAFQFLQAASDATDRPLGTYLARSVVPLAEPSVSAFGASGEVKLAFAMPAQEISYPLDVHGDPTALQYAWIRVGDTTLNTGAQPLTGDKVSAPPTAGFYRLALLKSGQRRSVEGLTLAVLVPFGEKERGMLRGYRIGTYLAERVRGKTPPPEGFLEISPADVDLPITKHLKVGDFLNHDQMGVWPSYAAVNPKLLDKLELVIQEIARWHGDKAVADIDIDVHSGFRAPAHNRRVRRAASDSQHQYGDAADVAIDANGDGKITAIDIRMIGLAVEIVELKHPDLIGGLGIYTSGHSSTNYVHIDVRGRRARWRGGG